MKTYKIGDTDIEHHFYEFKIRAWTGEKMLYHPTLKFEFNSVGWLNLPTVTILMPEGDNVTTSDVMLSTGIQDAHGVDIYDGDIVKVDWQDARYPPHNFVVEWDKESLYWQFEGGTPAHDKWAFEVVGNIYENPELMENVLY